jgi:hypothetical protein
MTESLPTAPLVAAAAIIILAKRPGIRPGLALGAALAALCLVRPAFQVTLPFLGFAWLLKDYSLRPPGRRRVGLITTAAAVAAGFLIVSGPWLVRNARAGIYGLSASNSAILWLGVCQSGLLSDDFPLPDEVRARYNTTLRANPSNDENSLQMVTWLNAWRSDENRTLLSDWATFSIRADPAAYAGMTLRAVGWQLQLFIPGKVGVRQRHDELRWIVRRLSANGQATSAQPYPNFNITGKPDNIDRFQMPAGRGPFVRYFRWWTNRHWMGYPRAVHFAAAAIAIVTLVIRRQWTLALVLLATLAYMAMHAAFLLVPSRYTAPCWTVWWIGVSVVVATIGRRLASSGVSERQAGRTIEVV